jgi:hypothetical protein
MLMNTTAACRWNELPWHMLLDFATQIAAAGFTSPPSLEAAQEPITKRPFVWLITEMYHRITEDLTLAEPIFLSKNSIRGKDKKDCIRALLGMVGGTWWRPCYQCQTSLLSMLHHRSRRAVVQDIMNNKTIPRMRKRQYEKLVASATHDSLVDLIISQPRAHCDEYKDTLSRCRLIATSLCQDTILYSRAVGSGRETW